MNGFDQTEVGSFVIKESTAGSLLPNCTVTLTLPSGAKWMTNGGGNWPENGKRAVAAISNKEGDLVFVNGNPTSTTDNGQTITFQVGAGSYSKSTILFDKLQVTIAPDFSGDLNITVGGTAGAAGEVKVASVSPRVKLGSDGQALVKIGLQNQKISDFTISETREEAFNAQKDNDDLVVALPAGATWYRTPTVTVGVGDVRIAHMSVSDRNLSITLKSNSSKASTITVSDAYVTIDRTVPEGDFAIDILGASEKGLASSAITDNAVQNKFNISPIAKVTVAQLVTPADQGVAVRPAVFTIGSTSYTLSGESQSMDVAPYIRDNRTFIPIRYVAYALGIADSNIIWDSANQTLTLMKGNKVVQLKIGNNIMLVNSVAITLDVVPEITDGRTCLPIAPVAQAFGATASWDATTQTVTVK